MMDRWVQETDRFQQFLVTRSANAATQTKGGQTGTRVSKSASSSAAHQAKVIARVRGGWAYIVQTRIHDFLMCLLIFFFPIPTSTQKRESQAPRNCDRGILISPVAFHKNVADSKFRAPRSPLRTNDPNKKRWARSEKNIRDLKKQTAKSNDNEGIRTLALSNCDLNTAP